MVRVRAGVKVAHQHGGCWGHQAFTVLKREGEALEEGTPCRGTVTWVPAVESETAPFKPGCYRVDRVAGRVYLYNPPANFLIEQLFKQNL